MLNIPVFTSCRTIRYLVLKITQMASMLSKHGPGFFLFTLVIFLIQSCEDSIPLEQQYAISHLKSDLLDANSFELIKVETQMEITELDELKQQIIELDGVIEDFEKLERIKDDVSLLMILNKFNNDDLDKDLSRQQAKYIEYKSEVEKSGANSAYAKALFKQLQGNPDLMQKLFLEEPDKVRFKQEKLRNQMKIIETSLEKNHIVYSVIYLRYYAVNRMGGKGINEKYFKVYSDFSLNEGGYAKRVQEMY